MEEQKQAIKILKKTNPSFQDMRQIVLKVRNNALSLADAVVEFGVSLIRKKSAALHDECNNKHIHTHKSDVCFIKKKFFL